MSTLSVHADQILRKLARHKNVLIVGPPATGKSHVMAEIRTAFRGTPPPAYDGKGLAPFPKVETRKVEPWMPSPKKFNRHVLDTTFHQGTKHRQFVSGISPKLTGQSTGFEVTEGILFQANRAALIPDSTSLLTIDEINRGPAVSIFGDTLTAIEADKRLDDNNKPLDSSATFYAYVNGGKYEACHLSPHLYLLASMNEADTSVEPLDVAFLRRFDTYRLEPEPKTAQEFLGIEANLTISDKASGPKDVYYALWRAWTEVNRRISLGRSPTFQLGHGVLMWQRPPTTLSGAIEHAAECWRRIEAHIDEVFFGNDQARAIVYNANDTSVYHVGEAYFGDQPVVQLKKTPDADLYKVLLQVGKNS